MQLSTVSHQEAGGWSAPLATAADGPRTLVLAFGPAGLADHPRPLAELTAAFPRSTLVGCSTSGTILGDKVSDEDLSVAVVRFTHTDLATAVAVVNGPGGSFEGRASGRNPVGVAGPAGRARLRRRAARQRVGPGPRPQRRPGRAGPRGDRLRRHGGRPRTIPADVDRGRQRPGRRPRGAGRSSPSASSATACGSATTRPAAGTRSAPSGRSPARAAGSSTRSTASRPWPCTSDTWATRRPACR